MSVIFIETSARHDSGGCHRDLNLLAHAQMIEFDLGSRCGGHGRCGADRVRLEEGFRDRVSPVTQIEKIHLTEDELRQGVRLACQCFPERDGVTIEVFPVRS